MEDAQELSELLLFLYVRTEIYVWVVESYQLFTLTYLFLCSNFRCLSSDNKKLQSVSLAVAAIMESIKGIEYDKETLAHSLAITLSMNTISILSDMSMNSKKESISFSEIPCCKSFL